MLNELPTHFWDTFAKLAFLESHSEFGTKVEWTSQFPPTFTPESLIWPFSFWMHHKPEEDTIYKQPKKQILKKLASNKLWSKMF